MSLYDHAGGEEGLHRLEELFYDKALADPVLRVLFTKRVPGHVDHLTWFTGRRPMRNSTRSARSRTGTGQANRPVRRRPPLPGTAPS
jgi:truncated hemoglobin YjbI